jgi:hypothetical protein
MTTLDEGGEKWLGDYPGVWPSLPVSVVGAEIGPCPYEPHASMSHGRVVTRHGCPITVQVSGRRQTKGGTMPLIN